MTLLDVVIVGAGMAGLVCAQRLQQAGYHVAVLEKSRGLGGRMATRRLEGVPIDHGARFLQPQGEMLTALARQFATQKLLTHWQPHAFYLDSAGQLHTDGSTHSYYVAPTGMSTVGKALGAGLTIYRQQRVLQILPTPDAQWKITAEHADDGRRLPYTAKAIVLAIPAPQISPLLEPLPSNSPFASLSHAIAAVHYAPCITVMAQYTPPIAQEAAPLPCEASAPWMVSGHPDTPFLWVGLDSSKRQAPSLNVVLQSSARWAHHWLAAPNRQAAGETLLTQAGQLIAPWLTQPVRWQVHRWRYALVETPCPQGVLSTSTPLPLAACGDWCGNHQIATALESGWAAADRINSSLDRKSLPHSFAEVMETFNW